METTEGSTIEDVDGDAKQMLQAVVSHVRGRGMTSERLRVIFAADGFSCQVMYSGAHPPPFLPERN